MWDKYEPKPREQLFPNLPQPPIPLSWSLSAYAGEYEHPGFGKTVVNLKDNKFKVDFMDQTWRYMLYLEHVPGEFFFIKRTKYPTKQVETCRAQF